MNSEILFQESLRFLTALLCFFIAARLGSRQISGQYDRLAWNAFRIWWWGIGALTLVGMLNVVLPLIGIVSLPLFVIVGQLNLIVLSVALWGLLFYLVYLFTGKERWAKPLGIFYAGFYLTLLAYILWLRPTSVEVVEGRAVLQYANEASPAYSLALTLVLVLPQLISSLAYFSFYFRVRERSQKYRILVVSLAIFVWFASPLLANLLQLGDLPWWTIASRLIALLAIGAIYWAYYPPRFMQKRLNVSPI